MAQKKKKQPQMSKRQTRRLRTQQAIMGVIGVVLILAFVLQYLVN